MTGQQFTAKQRAVLEAAAECGTERTITAVCEEAGVTRKSFYQWLKQDESFREAWEQVWYGAIRKHLPSVVSAMIAKAQKGDVQAARLVADMGGVIKQQHDHGGDVRIRIEYSDDGPNGPAA